jgi:hypothetical protein
MGQAPEGTGEAVEKMCFIFPIRGANTCVSRAPREGAQPSRSGALFGLVVGPTELSG